MVTERPMVHMVLTAPALAGPLASLPTDGALLMSLSLVVLTRLAA